MGWQEKDRMKLRKEFVWQAQKEGSNIAELCRRYSISRKTGYKWINRDKMGNENDLKDRSRKPVNSPNTLSEETIFKFIQAREKHPVWGARKLHALLKRQFPDERFPAPSTIHKKLSQQGYIKPTEKNISHLHRFEHEAPNRLWQMDFKGYFEYERGRCYPLTLLDDHSRFSIGLKASPNEQGKTIKPFLIEIFKRYGLPDRINVDNGNPWGSLYECSRYSTFSLWLIQLGVRVSYSRPGHPQTNGKDERFHRTLKLELINNRYFKNLGHIQNCFDEWRDIYNLERPHEAIGMQVPADRYQPSYRFYPEALPAIAYPEDYQIKTIDVRGRLAIEGRNVYVGMPFSKKEIGIKRLLKSEIIEIYFCHQKLGEIDLHKIPRGKMLNLYSKRMLRYNYDVLPMSVNKCYLCLRAIQA